MIAFFLLLVIVAMVLGIVGVAAKACSTCCSSALLSSSALLPWPPCGCGGPGSAQRGNFSRSAYPASAT